MVGKNQPWFLPPRIRRVHFKNFSQPSCRDMAAVATQRSITPGDLRGRSPAVGGSQIIHFYSDLMVFYGILWDLMGFNGIY